MRAVGVAVCSLACLVACGGSDSEDPEPGQRSLCDGETRADTYVAGLERSSAEGMYKVRLMDGTPAPPDKGDNRWTLTVEDASGPIGGAEVRLKAWMPDHGHGTNPLWQTAEETAAGTYRAGPFDLFMGGFWEFTVSVEPSGGQVDEAKFAFCLEG